MAMLIRWGIGVSMAKGTFFFLSPFEKGNALKRQRLFVSEQQGPKTVPKSNSPQLEIGERMTFVRLLHFLIVAGVSTALRPQWLSSFGRGSCTARLASHFTREYLEALPRAELQFLAKSRSIKANGKSVDIIDALLGSTEVNEAKVAQKVTVDPIVPSEKKISGKVLSRLSADALQVLEEQGIDLSDLLTLQMRSVQQSGSFVRSYPNGTQKRGKTAKDLPESDRSSDFSEIEGQKIPSTSRTVSATALSIDDLLKDQGDEESSVEDLKSIAHLIDEEEETSPDHNQIEAKARLPPRSRRMELIDLDGKENERLRIAALEGATLKEMLQQLSQTKGYDFLYRETHLRCFTSNPSLNSASKLLREPSMSWARRKIEDLYLRFIVAGRNNRPQS